MRKRLGSLFITCLLGSSLVLAADAMAGEDGPDECVDGVLATDPAGDGTYAGLTGTDLESDSGDIVEVSMTLPPTVTNGNGNGNGKGQGKANGKGKGLHQDEDADSDGEATTTFVTSVVALGDTGPHHFDLFLRLTLVTDSGDVISMEARRSTVFGETGSIDGSTEGVTAEFDEDADEIRLTVPSTALHDVNTVSLQLAQTRYDTGAVLSPLADEATGTCNIILNPDHEPEPAEDHSDLDTKILVIDTGVNGHHPEFADGQIFAWWDFSRFGGDQDPGTRTWFDYDRDGDLHGDRDDPYDPHGRGHGSSVSSMAAGSNAISPAKTPSACPGCSLAVAKVYDEDADSLNGSVGDAIRWGVDVLDVDVITISIGAIAPVPAVLLQDTYSAAEHARNNGVLVVFANGNGWGNAGVPGQPGGFMPYGNSPHVLSVGADELNSFRVTTDPEVVAVFSVYAAGPEGSEYQNISGTSFSAPFTAGVAARVIGEARACEGEDDVSADSIERLLKYTAHNRPEVPPTFEGYGEVTLETMAHSIAVACDPDTPLPTPDEFNDFYVTNVSGTQRELSTTSVAMRRTSFTDATGAREIGPSAPSGPKDVEIYTATVAPGETFTMTATGTGELADVYDFDMVLYAAPAGTETYTAADKLTSSGNGGSTEESVTWVNSTDSPVEVAAIVFGWAVGHSQPFDYQSSHELEPDFDGYVLADNLVGDLFG